MRNPAKTTRSSLPWGWIVAGLFAGLLCGLVVALIVILNNADRSGNTAASPSVGASTASPAPASPDFGTVEPSNVATDTPVAPEDVTVTLTTAYWDESRDGFVVSAYVNAIIEGGTCTAIALSAEARHEVSEPAIPGATTTDCGTMIFPGVTLSTGAWTLMVLFESADYEGISQEVTGLVP
jgi:hypothetical protein